MVLGQATSGLAEKPSTGSSRWSLVTTSLIGRPPVGYIQLYFLLRSFPGSQEEPTPALSHRSLSLGNALCSFPNIFWKCRSVPAHLPSPRDCTRAAGRPFSGLWFPWKEAVPGPQSPSAGVFRPESDISHLNLPNTGDTFQSCPSVS